MRFVPATALVPYRSAPAYRPGAVGQRRLIPVVEPAAPAGYVVAGAASAASIWALTESMSAIPSTCATRPRAP